MDDLQQITAEEAAGELIPGLNKVDHILIAAMFIVLGVLPVIWYAITYA